MHYAGARETPRSWDSGPPKHAPLPCNRPPFENPESAPVTDCANPQPDMCLVYFLHHYPLSPTYSH